MNMMCFSPIKLYTCIKLVLVTRIFTKRGSTDFFLIFGETEHLYAYPSEDNVHVYSIVNPVRFI